MIRASIVLVGVASAKNTSGPNKHPNRKLRGPQTQEQHGGSTDRALFFGNGDGGGGLEDLFGDGGLGQTFGGFGGGWTDGTSGNGGDGLSDAIEDVAAGLADAFAATGPDGTGGLDGGASDSVLAHIVGSFAEALDGLADTLEEGATAWNFTVTDWGDGAVWSGTEAGSGASVAGQVAGGFACPRTCADEGRCATVLAGTADPRALAEACDAGCLPAPASCDDVCGASADGAAAGQLPWAPTAVARFVDLNDVTNMACDSCKFLACCGEGVTPDDASKFDSCQDYFPGAKASWADITDVDFDTGDIQEWVAGLAEDMGLSDLFDGDLPSLLGEALAEFDSFPATCDRESCPVDGLCDANALNLATLDFDDLCAKDAFFECSEGLKATCDDQCGTNGDTGDSAGFKKVPFCTLCGIATCCTSGEERGMSFQDCALDALPEDLTTLLEKRSSSDVSIIGDTPAKEEEGAEEEKEEEEEEEEEQEVPATDALSEASGGSGPSGGGTPAATEDVSVESVDASPAGEGSASGGSSAGTAPAVEALHTEEDPAAVDGDGGPSVAAAASVPDSGFDFEVSRAEVQDSASYGLRTSAARCLALAFVATLFLASF